MSTLREFWRRSWIGKVVLIGASLCGTMMLCCVALVAIAIMAPSKPRSTAGAPTVQAIALRQEVESTATLSPTTPPTDVPPTETAIPSPTTEPPTATAEPTSTPAPEPSATPVPTAKPQPTAKPAPAVAIAPTAKPVSAPIPTAVDVGAAPCQPGQIKGNRNSAIYHAPGQRDYAKTYANVQCFDTEAEAVAAGYRKAKR